MSGDFNNDISYIDEVMRTEKSFDLAKRIIITKKGKKCAFFYITGFVNGSYVQDFMMYCLKTDANISNEENLPFVEASTSDNFEKIVKNILSGMTCFITEGAKKACLIDMRNLPLRSVSEPENDKVLRGARDGFGESLQANCALIRRRLRNPKLTFSLMTVGKSTKTDLCLAYIEGRADSKYIGKLKKQIMDLKTDSLNFQGQSVSEILIKKKWYNPFPKVRYTERPDTAAATILEGSVLMMFDNNPSVMILPTSIMDFFQETDDFCFPPLTGTYLRIIRFLVYISSIYLTPLWLWLINHPDYLPETFKFIALRQQGGLPVFLQLIIIEFAIDGMRLASLNTPDVLGNALSIVGGLILGDFAVSAGWFSPDVILYSAFVTIANFTQTSYELGYAIKFIRVLMLFLTAILGGFGIILGTIVMIILIFTNNSIDGGRSYLYPIYPLDKKVLKSLVFRTKKTD